MFGVEIRGIDNYREYMIYRKIFIAVIAFFLFPPFSAVSGSEQKTQVASNKFLEMPLSELMEVVVATPTKTQRKLSDTPANVIVVTTNIPILYMTCRQAA